MFPHVRTTSLRGARTSTWMRGEPGTGHFARAQPDMLDADRVDGRLHDIKRSAGIDKSTEEHVAAGAGLAAEPGEAHDTCVETVGVEGSTAG